MNDEIKKREPVERITYYFLGHQEELARLETVLEGLTPHWPRNPNYSDGSW